MEQVIEDERINTAVMAAYNRGLSHGLLLANSSTDVEDTLRETIARLSPRTGDILSRLRSDSVDLPLLSLSHTRLKKASISRSLENLPASPKGRWSKPHEKPTLIPSIRKKVADIEIREASLASVTKYTNDACNKDIDCYISTETFFHCYTRWTEKINMTIHVFSKIIKSIPDLEQTEIGWKVRPDNL